MHGEKASSSRRLVGTENNRLSFDYVGFAYCDQVDYATSADNVLHCLEELELLTQAGRIVVDGNPADWNGIQPLVLDPQDLYDEGLPRLTADLKEVYLTSDSSNLYFMTRFWGDVNLRPNPARGERVTSLYIRLASPGATSDLLIWIHPLWGKVWKYLSGDLDHDENFEEESDRIREVEMGTSTDVIETAVPIDALYQHGFSSLQLTNARFYSAAWHPLEFGGYGGAFDGTMPEWFSVSEQWATVVVRQTVAIPSTITTERLVVSERIEVAPARITVETVLVGLAISVVAGLLVAFATRSDLRTSSRKMIRRFLGHEEDEYERKPKPPVTARDLILLINQGGLPYTYLKRYIGDVEATLDKVGHETLANQIRAKMLEADQKFGKNHLQKNGWLHDELAKLA
ncbi:MAG: hypothetical protein WCC94_08355 [Candidatus Bathyarchaeia archaeon]